MWSSRRKRLLAVFASSALFALVVLLWPRGPRLVPYTSPPITFDGETAQLQALVPEGWVAGRPGYIHSAGAHILGVGVRFQPPKRMAWMPGWLRRFLMGPDVEGYLEISTDSRVISRSERVEVEAYPVSLTGDEAAYYRAHRHLNTGIGYSVYYSTRDKAEFERVHRPICESLKVTILPLQQHAPHYPPIEGYEW